MKALSIHQPWASLIAIGAKRVETRHWPAPASVVGTRIAIHAGKATDAIELGRAGAFYAALSGADRAGGLALFNGELPLGFVVATARLAACRPMDAAYLQTVPPGSPEHTFGHFALERFAWELDDVAALEVPVPCRGMQKVFNLPADVDVQVLAAERNAWAREPRRA